MEGRSTEGAPREASSQESFKNWRNDTFATLEGWLAAYNANPGSRARIAYENMIQPEMSWGDMTFYFAEVQPGVVLSLVRTKGEFLFDGEHSDAQSAVQDIKAKYPGALELRKEEQIEE